jgi:hypothetical protein
MHIAHLVAPPQRPRQVQALQAFYLPRMGRIAVQVPES